MEMSRWHQRYAGTLSELAAATLTAELAASRYRAALEQSTDDQPASRRTLRTGTARLAVALAQAGAIPEIPYLDADVSFRAGVARWRDALDALTSAADRDDFDELRRGMRAGRAGNEELMRAQRAIDRIQALLAR
jgi:hypothetical protein